MNDINIHIAQAARTEVDRTNALYYPIHNMWMVISFLMLALSYLLEAMGHGQSAPFLMLSTMTLLPAAGVGIKQAALVKRNWALWTSLIGDVPVNPGSASKQYVVIGNLTGSIIFGALLLATSMSEMAAHPNPRPYNMIQIVCATFVIMGAVMYAMAESHKPKFTLSDGSTK